MTGRDRRADPPPAVSARPHPRGTRTTRHYLGLVAAAATLLAAAPLAALFAHWTWLSQGAVAVAAVLVAATAARWFRVPVALQPPAMLGALLLAVSWQFSPAGAPPLPTPGTLAHVADLLAGVPDELTTETLPAGDRAGLLLLTMLGIGLVAVLVDLLAVGIRRPALAGLPMLAVYSVPVAVSDESVPPLAFALAVLGYLWLVAADNLDRVRRFGRRFTGDGHDVSPWEPSPLAAIGRRLAVVGALAAVALPLAVPGATSGLADRFGPGGGGDGDGGGSGSANAVNLFASLDGLLDRSTTTDLIRYTTTDPDPPYLRVGVAGEISADGFEPTSPSGDPLPGGVPEPTPPPPGVTEHPHRAGIEVLDWEMTRAPVFGHLRGLDGLDDGWRFDRDQQVVHSADSPATGRSYEIEYVRREYDPQALAGAGPLPGDHPANRFTELPPGPEPRVSALVDDLVGDAESPYQRARAILEHFSEENGFRYSLETGPETTGSALQDFLFEHQAGYCVQYAASMAWLAREAGLPSRVVIGFTRGSEQGQDTGDYVLTNHNLHAWTEVYFHRFGWVPFDPTPRSGVAGAVDRSWAPDPDRPADPVDPESGDEPGATASPQGGPGTAPPENPVPAPGAGAPPTEGSGGWSGWLTAAGLVAALTLLAAPALHRLGLRRRRTTRPAVPAGAAPVDDDPGWRDRAHAAWDELLDLMVDHRIPVRESETPRATVTRLVHEHGLADGTAADAVRLVGHAEERARYAPRPLSPDGLAAALRTVRSALSARSGLPHRVRATVLPPSTLARWRDAAAAATGRVADVVNRLGVLRNRLSPRRRLRI